MNKLISTFLLALLAFPTLSSAQVYKWKDKNGITQYSDTPPPSVKAEEVKAKAPPPKPTQEEAEAAGKKTESPLKKLDKDAAKRQQEAEDVKKSDETKEAEAKVKEANCASAKANYNTYKQGGRIIKNNEKGERQYLSDADIAKGLEDSKQTMDKYCN